MLINCIQKYVLFIARLKGNLLHLLRRRETNNNGKVLKKTHKKKKMYKNHTL